MKTIKTLFLGLFLVIGFACKETPSSKSNTQKTKSQPTLSITFDDGITHDILDYQFEDWNQMILNSLEEAQVKAMFFVTGVNKLDQKGQYLLKSWDQQQHSIANHTFSHPNFNDKNNTPEMFESELLMTDSIINQYEHYVKYFRFPYLKEGKTKTKIDGIRSKLAKHGYQNGYVTIDASDWYVNSRLIKKMKSDEPVDTSAFQAFYIDHLLDRAIFYEKLSFQLYDRHVKHTLLLHHNLTSALFLKPLIEKFRSEGWKIIDADEAYKDPVYQNIPNVVPAGESLIWSLAKQDGNFEDLLRYPAEDSRYEKDKMDQLNL